MFQFFVGPDSFSLLVLAENHGSREQPPMRLLPALREDVFPRRAASPCLCCQLCVRMCFLGEQPLHAHAQCDARVEPAGD